MMSDNIGIGWSFPPSFKNGNAEMVSSNQEIRQALEIILMTVQGERFLRPDFGVGLREYQFSSMSPAVRLHLQELIKEEIRTQEKRVNVENVEISDVDNLEGKFVITVIYSTEGSEENESLRVTII